MRAIDAAGNVGAPASFTWTVTVPPAPNTPVGSDVAVEVELPAGQSATVTFTEVTAEGFTTVEELAGAPPLPLGYESGSARSTTTSTRRRSSRRR